MSYFAGFPFINYKFGDEPSNTVFTDIGLYVDIIDQVKDNVNFYTAYNIIDGERPDTLSQKLYGSPDLYWTFFLMNDNIRENGWPLTQQQLLEKVQKDAPNITLTTANNIASIFAVGQTITGAVSTASAVVVAKRLDFGQIIVSPLNSFSFQSGEAVNSVVGATTETITITGRVEEYNSVHHYEDANGYHIDIDPFTGTVGNNVPITVYDYYVRANDDLKTIRAIKPDAVNGIYRAFKDALSR